MQFLWKKGRSKEEATGLQATDTLRILSRSNTVDEMVRPEGIEPPTPGSEVRCSIQLSYGRIRHFNHFEEGLVKDKGSGIAAS